MYTDREMMILYSTMYLTSHEIIVTSSVLTACVLLAAVTWNSFPTCSTVCIINRWCNLWVGESTFCVLGIGSPVQLWPMVRLTFGLHSSLLIYKLINWGIVVMAGTCTLSVGKSKVYIVPGVKKNETEWAESQYDWIYICKYVHWMLGKINWAYIWYQRW